MEPRMTLDPIHQFNIDNLFKIGQIGNPGPGQNLTHIGARLSPHEIENVLVSSSAPMPSFKRTPTSGTTSFASCHCCDKARIGQYPLATTLG